MKHLLALALLIPILQVGATPALAAGDDLVIGMAQFPSSLHPDIDPEVVKMYGTFFALREITAFDADWQNSCLLCTELPTLANGLAKFEDQPDGTRGMAVTLTLKPGLAWGDGVPVTAHDIVFTWRVARDPAAGFSNVNPWSRASAVDVVDDRTVVLHLPRVMVSYNQWDQIIPEHVEAKAATGGAAGGGGPGEYLKNTAYNRAPTTPGLWDGPYMVTQYDSGVQIVLEPNPHWPGPTPGFKHIVLRHIENTAALQANLLSGDVDMVAGEGVGLTIDQVTALQKQHGDDFTFIFKPSLNFEHIDLKRENPLLADPRVRRALLMSIDRQTLVDRLFQGRQPVAATWVNPLSPYYNAAVPVVAFDLAGAKALFAAAGWAPGPDGVLRNAAGDRFAIELGTTAGNRLRELQEQVLQSNWKAAGVEVTLKNEPARTLFGETLKKRTYTGLEMYAWSSTVTETPLRNLSTGQIPTAANNFGGANFTGFTDPAMDADIAAAETELDPAKQQALWADMQRIYAEQLPALPLFFRAEAHVVPKWLKGYVPTGHSDYSSLWAENWHR